MHYLMIGIFEGFALIVLPLQLIKTKFNQEHKKRLQNYLVASSYLVSFANFIFLATLIYSPEDYSLSRIFTAAVWDYKYKSFGLPLILMCYGLLPLLFLRFRKYDYVITLVAFCLLLAFLHPFILEFYERMNMGDLITLTSEPRSNLWVFLIQLVAYVICSGIAYMQQEGFYEREMISYKVFLSGLV